MENGDIKNLSFSTGIVLFLIALIAFPIFDPAAPQGMNETTFKRRQHRGRLLLVVAAVLVLTPMFKEKQHGTA